MAAIPIRAYSVGGGASDALPEMRRLAEEAAESFLLGVPVKLDANGFVEESPAINAAGATLLGISAEFGHNLTTAGVPKTLTYGSVANQPNAVLIPGGAPLSDGNIGVLIANDETEFVGVVTAAHGLVQTDIGAIYGLTKDANNQWYVDIAKNTTALGAVVIITRLVDPIGTAGGKVAFKFLRAAQQLQQ